MTDVLQTCGGGDRRPLLQGLGGFGQSGHLRFKVLHPGIEAFLAGLIIQCLVAQEHEDAQTDQPKPEQALHHHGSG